MWYEAAVRIDGSIRHKPKRRPRMANKREGLSQRVKERIAACQAEVREILYGEAGCPVWGTKFAEIERTAMSVGEELSRQFMALVAEAQRGEMPEEAMTCGGEPATPAGTETRQLITEAGPVEYQTVKGYLPKSRRAFFPSGAGAGNGH
jgi:hypothetical protein